MFSALGVVEREKIIDGSRIIAGDAILALASNGLHTNGFSLIRKLIEERPAISHRKIGKRNAKGLRNRQTNLTGRITQGLEGQA